MVDRIGTALSRFDHPETHGNANGIYERNHAMTERTTNALILTLAAVVLIACNAIGVIR